MMNNYETMQAIGRGAYGNVYLYRRKSDSNHVVIKKIHMESITNEEGELTKNEVHVLSMLQHPNIIEYYDNFLENNTMMIVMEYAPGGNLYDYLRMRGEGNLLQEEDVLHLFSQMVQGLQHIHEINILHRDIKSNNILLDRSHRIVKIGDFGISKILSSKSKAHTVVGTPCYLSPELCQEKPYNQRSDIWALGCVLYEMLTLRRAFEAETLPALIMKIMRGIFEPIHPHYSSEMRSLVHLLLHTDPAQRPDSHQVISHPLVFPALCRLNADLGMLPCVSRPLRLSSVGTRGRSSRGSEDSTDRERLIENDRRIGSEEGREERERRVVGESDDKRQGEEGNEYEAEARRLRNEDGRSDIDKIEDSGYTSPPVPSSSIFCWSPHGQPLRLSLGEAEGEATQVSASSTHRLVITNLGHLSHWPNLEPKHLHSQDVAAAVDGDGSDSDDDSEAYVAVVVKCPATVRLVEVACGDGFMACVTDRGILLTMGQGSTGSLGHGTTDDVGHLRMVESLLGVSVAGVACGPRHILALTQDGAVYAWGSGSHGRLGVGSRMNRLQPRPVELPECMGEDDEWQVTGVAAGDDASFLITTSGILLAAGSNRYNKLCVDETDSDGFETLKRVEEVTTFVPVCSHPLANHHIVQVASGPTHSLFITDEGEVWSSGCNTHNQLGRSQGTPLDPRVPTKVELAGAKVAHVACGSTFSLAITTDGVVHAWGGQRVETDEDVVSLVYPSIPSHPNANPSHPHLSREIFTPSIVNFGHKLRGNVSIAANKDFVLISHSP